MDTMSLTRAEALQAFQVIVTSLSALIAAAAVGIAAKALHKSKMDRHFAEADRYKASAKTMLRIAWIFARTGKAYMIDDLASRRRFLKRLNAELQAIPFEDKWDTELTVAVMEFRELTSEASEPKEPLDRSYALDRLKRLGETLILGAGAINAGADDILKDGFRDSYPVTWPWRWASYQSKEAKEAIAKSVGTEHSEIG